MQETVWVINKYFLLLFQTIQIGGVRYGEHLEWEAFNVFTQKQRQVKSKIYVSIKLKFLGQKRIFRLKIYFQKQNHQNRYSFTLFNSFERIENQLFDSANILTHMWISFSFFAVF